MNARPQETEETEYAPLVLEEMGPLGDSLARFEDQQINVFGGIPGEEVIAQIVRYRRRRKAYISGLVAEVTKPSPHRIEPPCPYFGPCSGCQWQHIEYSHQLRLKQEYVERQLQKYVVLEHLTVSPTMPAENAFGYRNHARFTIRKQGTLGFINRITRRFVQVDNCMLMAPWINDTLAHFQGKCEETTQLSMRYGVNTGEFLVQPTLHSQEIQVRSGQTHYTEKLGGKSFRIASPSFFQVNTRQTELMAELVRKRLALSGDELLVDAYAGVGTFAVLLADSVRKVIAIEESAAAVKDAEVNTSDVQNLEYRRGKTEDILDTLEQSPDVVILDPPRVGCHPDTLTALIRRTPSRVVYISCDPEPLARDLQLLVQGGFRVEAVEPIDMFPQTHHVECIVTLRHRG